MRTKKQTVQDNRRWYKSWSKREHVVARIVSRSSTPGDNAMKVYLYMDLIAAELLICVSSVAANECAARFAKSATSTRGDCSG